jgi:hypothetical protein
MALELSRQGWSLSRIQAHLNAYLGQSGEKSVLTYSRKGYPKGAANYRDTAATGRGADSAAAQDAIREGLAAGRLVRRKGEIVEALSTCPPRPKRKAR